MPLCTQLPANKRGKFLRTLCKIRNDKSWISESVVANIDWINLISAHLALTVFSHPGDPLLTLKKIRLCKTAREARLYTNERESGTMSLGAEEMLTRSLGKKTRLNPIITEALYFSSAWSAAAFCPLPPDSAEEPDWRTLITEQQRRIGSLDDSTEITLVNAHAVSNEIAFLSVASQIFFEECRLLTRKQRRLYTCLKHFYGIDPASPTWQVEDIQYRTSDQFVNSETTILR